MNNFNIPTPDQKTEQSCSKPYQATLNSQPHTCLPDYTLLARGEETHPVMLRGNNINMHKNEFAESDLTLRPIECHVPEKLQVIRITLSGQSYSWYPRDYRGTRSVGVTFGYLKIRHRDFDEPQEGKTKKVRAFGREIFLQDFLSNSIPCEKHHEQLRYVPENTKSKYIHAWEISKLEFLKQIRSQLLKV